MSEPVLGEHDATIAAVAPPPPPAEPPEGDPRRSPRTAWPWWSAFAALAFGLVLAAVVGLVIDIPAVLLGANVTSSHTPAGLNIADTFAQDVCFVAAAVFCAHLGGRAVYAWQLGLRPPGVGWRTAAAMIVTLFVSFLVISAIWSALVSPGKDKLLEQLGTNESAALLLLSAALTCVVAPIAEEMLFRAYIFTALRNRFGTLAGALGTGVLFGAVHVGSAPALLLVPLAALGFGLCLLYRYSGSIYPCVIAHSVNNSIAFASLEGWGWQAIVLLAAAIACILALIRLTARLGYSGTGLLVARSAA